MKNLKNFKFTLLAAVLLALTTVIFVSCEPETPENDNVNYEQLTLLDGEWVSTYGEHLTIDIEDGTLNNSYGGSTSYAGNNLYVVFSNKDCTKGYIYIKYTENPYYGSSVVGKWYAIAFKNLTETSMSFSGAYGTKTCTDTLSDAISEFTIANGYFGTYSESDKSE